MRFTYIEVTAPHGVICLNVVYMNPGCPLSLPVSLKLVEPFDLAEVKNVKTYKRALYNIEAIINVYCVDNEV